MVWSLFDIDNHSRNVKWINADKLWALGFTGQNTVVGGADTGIQFDHPALKTNYRGFISENKYSHDYNWYDGVRMTSGCRSRCGCNLAAPCDDQGHVGFFIFMIREHTPLELHLEVLTERLELLREANGLDVCEISSFIL
jgi:hypothetical protein